MDGGEDVAFLDNSIPTFTGVGNPVAEMLANLRPTQSVIHRFVRHGSLVLPLQPFEMHLLLRSFRSLQHLLLLLLCLLLLQITLLLCGHQSLLHLFLFE